MAKTEFREIVNKKGYTFKDLMELWNVSARQMTRYSTSQNPKHLHMAYGLPDKSKSKSKKGQKNHE